MSTNGNGQFLESELIHRKVKVDNEWQTRTFPVVGGRLRILHENNDHLGIQTEIVRLDNDFVVVKAAVESQRGKFNGTGTARVKEMQNSQTRWLNWLKQEHCSGAALRRDRRRVHGAEEVSHVAAADSEKEQTGEQTPCTSVPRRQWQRQREAKAPSGAPAETESKPKSCGMQTGAGTVMNSLKGSV